MPPVVALRLYFIRFKPLLEDFLSQIYHQIILSSFSRLVKHQLKHLNVYCAHRNK